MAKPNNAFPRVVNGQVLLGNPTLRFILANSERVLTRNIREKKAKIASNNRYVDRLARMLEAEDLREADVIHLRQRRVDIQAETVDLRGQLGQLEEHRRIVREASAILNPNNP